MGSEATQTTVTVIDYDNKVHPVFQVQSILLVLCTGKRSALKQRLIVATQQKNLPETHKIGIRSITKTIF